MRREAGALLLYRLAEFGPWVAMLVYAYSRGGATETGIVSLALLAPTALCAPLAGPLIDRFGAGRVLVGAYASQSLAMAATAASLLSGAPALLSYALGAATAMLLVITHPAHAVVSPGIVRSTEELVALNALTGWILSLGLVMAPAGAGAILAVSTSGAVYAAGSACLVLATLLVANLRDLVPPLVADADIPTRNAIHQLNQGARALARAAAPREVVIVLGATFLMVGAFDVLVVVLAVGTLGIGESGAGYLAAAHGAGAVLGAFISPKLLTRARLMPVMAGASLVAAAAFVTLGLEVSVVSAFAAAAVTGASRSLLEVTGQTMLQRVTSTQLLARVFAFKEGLAMAAWGLGSALVPIAIALVDIRGALLVTGAMVPTVVLLRLRPLMDADRSPTYPTVRIALLRSLGIFRSLPVPALEGLAQNATELSVSIGQIIIRLGETGDRYYVIAGGTVEVSRGGERVAVLGRGDGFGEMALVLDVPRTATVTALTDTTLCVIEREAFLVALTGHAPTRDNVAQFVTDLRRSDPV